MIDARWFDDRTRQHNMNRIVTTTTTTASSPCLHPHLSIEFFTDQPSPSLRHVEGANGVAEISRVYQHLTKKKLLLRSFKMSKAIVTVGETFGLCDQAEMHCHVCCHDTLCHRLPDLTQEEKSEK